jgi:hypothetical protein
MSLSIYSKASTDSLLALKANLSGATFTGAVTAPGLTITSGSGGVLTFADGTTMSTASGGGGGATWGSITGSISSQTDLQTEFGNYLPLAGGTMTGGLTVASAGITFSDSSVQTTAATAFNGGTISNPLTIDSAMGPQLYVTDSTHTTSPQIVVTNGTDLQTTIKSNSITVYGDGYQTFITNQYIEFSDGTGQYTAGVPLNGSVAMTGSLTLGGDLNGGGYNLTDCNFNATAGQVNCQNVVLTAGDGGSVTFADGSVQTTAASAGYTALQATTDSLMACMNANQTTNTFNLMGWAGLACYFGGKFQSGSAYQIGFSAGSPVFFGPSIDPAGYFVGTTSLFTSPTGYYLYYSQDGGTTWTQSSFPF